MKAYQIRPVELDDIGAVASVALASWKHTYGSIYPEDVINQFVAGAYSTNSLTNSVDRDSKRSHRLFHVAVDANGNVIAFSHVVPCPNSDTSFEWVRVYALPQAYGTGVGTALLHQLLQAVPNLSELSAWVEQDNLIGRKFYERHGFEVVEKREEEFFGYKTQLLKYSLERNQG